jgi:hypothetical protein
MAGYDWMSLLPDSTTLNKLIMPGSHDAGMAIKATDTTSGSLASIANACTQDKLISEQLQCGARWFDVRISTTKDKTATTKYPKGMRCFHSTAFGEPLKQVADGICQFVVDNPTETVIVLLTKSQDEAYFAFLDAIETYSSDWQGAFNEIQAPIHRQIGGLELRQVRGRVIVAMDKPPKRAKSSKMIIKAKLSKWDADKKFKDTDHYNWSTVDSGKKADSNQYSFILNTAGSYSKSSSDSTIRSRQEDRAKFIKEKFTTTTRYFMHVYYTTNTSEIGLRSTSIQQADTANWSDTNKAKWRPVAIQSLGGWPVFNTVMMDFVSDARCDFIRTEAAKLNF